MKIFLASLAGILADVYADIPTGIIGGQGSSNAYAAFVSSNGDLSPISDLPVGGILNSVAINNSGFSLIGGRTASPDGYAAFVDSNGELIPLSLSFSGGDIQSVAINQNSVGLIGGQTGAFTGYVALVSPDGTVNSLSTAPGDNILSVSLNDATLGLIGGEGGSHPYAAYVASNGTVSQILGPPAEAGRLYAAINDQGNGIIGGYTFTGSPFGAYAAFVSPGEGITTLLSPIPIGGGQLFSVAINHSGIGLIGGADESGNAYAGYAALDGTVTPLFESPFPGSLTSVALNDAGTGLLGGTDESNLYAALVQPDGTVLPLIAMPPSGEIHSVAINQAGVGLIVGQEASSFGYAALVAPNGTLTPLDVSSTVSINSTSVGIGSGITNAATPQSSGPHYSAIYTQLAAASTIEYRIIQQNKIWIKAKGSEIARADISQNEQNLAYNEIVGTSKLSQDSKKQPALPLSKKNTLWIAPFGNYVHLKEQGSIPGYTNEIGGALLAYDHQEINYLVGAALGYAFNCVGYAKGIGHSKIQEELANIYGSYYTDHFRFTGVLWGGVYQFANTRHTLSIITSKSKTRGWIVSPHIEIASLWAIDQKQLYFVEPFFMLDWVNSSQKKTTETGAAGFNLKMGSIYGSFLQSEVGCRFYEHFIYTWGSVYLEEKLSYVNQAPFYRNSVTTSFVSSASTFPIAIGSTTVENLAALQITGTLFPKNNAYPFGGFSIQTTANGSYQSYFVSLFGGINF